jgi:alkylation response protein AidB-like acyl-CoA dehydrogenase
VAAENTEAAESGRDLAPEVVAAVVEAGFARYFVPERFGGLAGDGPPDYRGLLEAVATIGTACASTAWFASLTASLGRMTAFLPAAGQSAIWADGPDPVIVGALMPSGRAVAEPGGWRLSGRWPYVSGVSHADWALVCSPAVGADGAAQPRFFAVKHSDHAVVESWFSVGMRGTGSNTIVVDDVFVPEGHSCSRDELLAGDGGPDTPPACRTPLRAVNGMTFAAPLLGAARGALAAYAELAAARPGLPSDAELGHLARVDGEIETAALLLERVAAAAERGEHSAGDIARATRDCALAAELIRAAVDRLVRSAGTGGLSETSVLQRFWRDVVTGSSHIVLRFDAAATAYGAVLAARLDPAVRGQGRTDGEGSR